MRKYPFTTGCLFILLALAALTAGCAPPPPGFQENTPVEAPVESTLPAKRTALPAKTVTPEPQPSASVTPTGAGTRTATPNTDFFRAEIKGVSFTPSWRLIVTIETYFIPRGVYYALIDGPDRYDCETLRTQPFHLYCSGPQVPVEEELLFRLYDAANDQLVFEEVLVVPLQAAMER